MRISELKNKLIAEGCNKHRFGVMCITDDAYNIMMIDNRWEVFYSERGKNSKSIFISDDEQESCDYFYNLILNEKHWHLVGFCKDENDVNQIEDQLKEINVKPIRNDIPAYTNKNDPRYRIFVEGKDVFKVIEHFGKVVLKYDC